MAIFCAVFTIGAEIQVSEEESAIILDELETVIEEIDALGIFVHNTLLALPMFIPGFGIAWGSFAAMSTGMAFSVLKVKKISIREDIRVVGIEIAILIGLLLAGGFIEYYLIQNIPADIQI